MESQKPLFERLSHLDVIKYQDDLYSIEAVFEYLQKNNQKYLNLLQTSRDLSYLLFNALPPYARVLHDLLTDQLANQSDLLNDYAYCQGVCTAMAIYYSRPLPSTDTGAVAHVNLAKLYSSKAYVEGLHRIHTLLNQINAKHPTSLRLAIACSNATAMTDSEHAKYCYLWGIEFGLRLCKNVDSTFVEDIAYVQAAYICILSDDAPWAQIIGGDRIEAHTHIHF